jgi:hypothetical protein
VFSFQPFNFSKVANFSWEKIYIAKIHQNMGFFQKFLKIERKLPEEENQ